MAAIGEDGDSCVGQLEGTGVHGHFIKKAGEKTTFAFILTDRQGENRVTVYRGAELTPADVTAFEAQIAESAVLLLQNEVPEAVNTAAARIAKCHGVTVVLNPAPSRPISETLAQLVDLVTPNEQEREALAGLHFPACVTTLGASGCDVNGAHLPAFPVEALDTTGAGDTFNGVLAVCLGEGKSLPEACRWACAAASLSVTKKGVINAIPHREETERMILS